MRQPRLDGQTKVESNWARGVTINVPFRLSDQLKGKTDQYKGKNTPGKRDTPKKSKGKAFE